MWFATFEVALFYSACLALVYGMIYIIAIILAPSFANNCPSAETLKTQVQQNLKGKVILITGATSGIGKETARVLCQANCVLILGCRNVGKAQKLVDELSNKHNAKARMIVEKLELSDLNQIETEFVHNLSNKHKITKINVLLCNAGIMLGNISSNPQKSVDGYELTFATNHLGHMQLALLLKSMLEAGATTEKSKLIVTSSCLHAYIPHSHLPTVDDITHKEKRAYDPILRNKTIGLSLTAYGWSKLCNIWFVREFEERFGKENKIIAVSLHPGVGQTGLIKFPAFVSAFAKLLNSVGQLAFTQTWLASVQSSKIVGGQYYRGTEIAKTAKIINQKMLQRKLWNLSEKLIKNSRNITVQ